GFTLFFSRRCLSQRRGLPRVSLLESLASRRQLDVGEPDWALPDADVSRDARFWPAQWRAPASVAASFRGPAGDVLDGAPPRPYPSRRRARGVDLHAFHLVQPAPRRGAHELLAGCLHAVGARMPACGGGPHDVGPRRGGMAGADRVRG